MTDQLVGTYSRQRLSRRLGREGGQPGTAGASPADAKLKGDIQGLRAMEAQNTRNGAVLPYSFQSLTSRVGGDPQRTKVDCVQPRHGRTAEAQYVSVTGDKWISERDNSKTQAAGHNSFR